MANSSRGKLAAAVVTAVAVIGATHFLVFRDNAGTYEEARSYYQGTRDEITRLGAPKPWPEIYRFQYETLNHEIRFQELLRDASLCVEQDYRRPPERVDDDAHLRAIVNIVWDHSREIQRLAGQSQNQGRYTFLRGERNWNLLDDFPAAVREQGVAIEDLLENVRESVTVLENVSETSPMRAIEEQNYQQRLRRIGLNTLERDYIEENFGEAVAFLYTLNRIQLVKNAVPRQRRGFQTDDQYNRELFRLFGLEIPDETTLYFYGKQLATLRNLLEMSEERGITAVDYVRLWETREQHWPPQELTEDDETGAGGDMGMMPEEMMMYGGMDPAMMGMMDPAMMEMMGMDPSMMGMGMGMGMEGAAEIEDDRDYFAYNVPIEISVVGSNSAVLGFYHNIANLPQILEMDTFRVDALPQQENQIRGRSVVKLTAAFHEFIEQCDAVEDNILRLLNEKRQIAERPGARELAEAEGFLQVMSEIPEYEGELRPAPENAPAAAPGMDPGMDPMMMGM